jgi:hypothetical protein
MQIETKLHIHYHKTVQLGNRQILDDQGAVTFMLAQASACA